MPKPKLRANPPEVCADHYEFWRTNLAGGQHKVHLQDQFNEFDAVLGQVEYLGNPVIKRRDGHPAEEIHHPSIHLLAYRMEEGPKAPPLVRIQNQFTSGDWVPWHLGAPRYLLIPASKKIRREGEPPGPPLPRVDHFVCYEVKEAPEVDGWVDLEDQFDQISVKGLKPIFLGVPADKNGEGLIHPEVHLAIYEYPPVGFKEFDRIDVLTADQLQRLTLSMHQSVWLGVPSFKKLEV